MKGFVLGMAAVAAGMVAARVEADDLGVEAILELYRAARPGADELGLYRLDWAGDLEEALERAASERRPVFLVLVRQQQDYTDILSGHC